MKKLVLSCVVLGTTSLFAFSLSDAANLASTVQQVQQKPASTQASQTKTNDLTSMLVQQLGVSQQQASGGVGSILSYAKDQLPQNKYTQLASAIPNADALMKMAPKAKSAGGLASMASSLGGNVGGMAQMASLASQFSSLGLNSGMITKFVPVITSYLQGSGSTGAISALTSLFAK